MKHGLMVWLRDERIAYLEEIRQRWGDLNWPPDREEYGRLTAHPVRQTFTIPGKSPAPQSNSSGSARRSQWLVSGYWGAATRQRQSTPGER